MQLPIKRLSMHHSVSRFPSKNDRTPTLGPSTTFCNSGSGTIRNFLSPDTPIFFGKKNEPAHRKLRESFIWARRPNHDFTQCKPTCQTTAYAQLFDDARAKNMSLGA